MRYSIGTAGTIGVDLVKQIEYERLTQLQSSAEKLKKKLSTVHGRCPICTLMPPCKHTLEVVSK